MASREKHCGKLCTIPRSSAMSAAVSQGAMQVNRARQRNATTSVTGTFEFDHVSVPVISHTQRHGFLYFSLVFC